MSKIVLTPNASGTGTFTIQSPNSNTDRTFTLPDRAGELSVSITSANDPAADSNPDGGVGTVWTNSTSGKMYVLTDATEDANVWKASGGASGATSLVASGAITAGDTVGVLPSGLAKTVTTFVDETSPQRWESSGTVSWMDFTYDTTNDKLIIAYSYNSVGYVVAGSVSGDTITWGTPLQIETVTPQNFGLCHDPSTGKTVVAWNRFSELTFHARVLTVSGTTITAGSTVTVASSNGQSPLDVEVVFDSNANKPVIFFSRYNTNFGQARVGTISGTSISFGSTATWETSRVREVRSAFDSTNNKIILTYRLDSDDAGYAQVATVSGTSISFGTKVKFSDTFYGYNPLPVYDPDAERLFVTFTDSSTAEYYTIGEVSGTSITFQSPVKWSSATLTTADNKDAVYFPDDGRVHIFYFGDGKLNYQPIKVKSTDVEFGVPAVAHSDQMSYTVAVYDPDEQKIIFGGRGTGGETYILDPLSSYSGYIGLASEDIADGATVSITTTGGLNENQSSLIVGQTYYVQDNGSISTTSSDKKVGVALSSTNILLT